MSDQRKNVAGYVFAPSIALMDRLRYGAKFGLIGALLFIPIAVLSYLNTSSQSAQVDFNWKEHLGVDYADPLKDFLVAVQRHRVVRVAMLSGDGSLRETEAEVKKTADAAAARVTGVDSRSAARIGVTYGALMQTTARWNAIASAWDQVKERSKTNATDLDAEYERLTADITDLMLNSVANYSNLILDPDLDSYWLMDAYVGKLPLLGQTISRAGTAAMLASDDPSGRQLNLAGAYKLATSTSADLRDVNMATAFKETINPANPNRADKKDLQTNLKPALDLFEAGVQSHADAVVKAAFVSNATLPAGSTARSTLATLGELQSLYQAVTPELDAMILKRVTDKYERARTLGILATGGAVLLLIFLFAGFFLSVRASVVSISAATRAMIAGTTERFAARSRDELGDVLAQYNDINVALTEARTLRAKVEADNQGLQRNIMDMLEVVSTASEGNLTVRAHVTEGAMGNVADAFNQLLESLQKLIGEIDAQQHQSTEVVNTIRQTVQSMAAGATTQATELRHANALIENMTAEIERVSVNARSAADAAQRTEGSARDGSKNVDQVVLGMDQLRANVQSGAKKMKLLGDRSMEITGIVNVINRISEQTNMLALNAAIEAARAGEHGRGFSVVAEEVRKLAERTAVATQEIDKLVKAIQSETNETISAMDAQTEVVERESNVVTQAGASLARIREVSTESAALVAEISNVAVQQVTTARSVVGTMGQISGIAQRTEDGAQHAAGAMVTLVTAFDQLSKSIGRFRLS